MAERLAVWLGNQRVGTLEPARREGVRYVPEPGAPSISAGVRSPDQWTPQRSTAWFDGLLPEGEMRGRIAARFGLAERDVFGLLEAVGWECAGAISVLPDGRLPNDGRYRVQTDRDVGERLDALPGRPLDDDSAVRASLGGVQSKLVLARRGDEWLEPIDGAPSTHILKPEPEAWPGIALAEAWALRVAAEATAAAHADVRDGLGSRPVVVVERFDRIDGDPVRRIHQEDLCQLLGLPPAAKYAEPPPKDWKPSLRWMASVLLARSADPPAELDRLLRQTVVNLALGNADAHGKNLGVLHLGRDLVSLTPMYDVVPTLAFLPRQTHAALPVGGRYRLTEIGVPQVVLEARDWGIPERLARSTISATIASMRTGFVTADAVYPALPARIREATITQFERFAGTENISLSPG